MLALSWKVVRGIVIIAGLSACAASPPPRLYLLEAVNPVIADKTAGTPKRVIGLGPVAIPALLERKQIVTRPDSNTVHIAEFHQWAEPLSDNVVRVLTQNLAALRPHQAIRAYPWSAYGPVQYRLVIDIERFDTRPGYSANLDARWSIIDEKTHAEVIGRQTRIARPLVDSSYPAAVKGMNEALYEFSRELASALEQVK